MREKGIDLHVNETVKGFVQKDGLAVAVIANNQTIPADLIILGLGVIPNSELAKNAGIPLGPKESIKVNELQQTEIPNICPAWYSAFSLVFSSQKGGCDYEVIMRQLLLEDFTVMKIILTAIVTDILSVAIIIIIFLIFLERLP